MKLTINIKTAPLVNIDMKTYLDMVAARVRFFMELAPWCFDNDEAYREKMMIKAKHLGITEEDITNYIKDNELDDLPF